MLLNLTYTLPPFFALGYDIRRNSMSENFDPSAGQVLVNKSSFRRWVRGFFSGGMFQIAINIWHLVYFLASLSMCKYLTLLKQGYRY
jgi:hypothetical protein